MLALLIFKRKGANTSLQAGALEECTPTIRFRSDFCWCSGSRHPEHLMERLFFPKMVALCSTIICYPTLTVKAVACLGFLSPQSPVKADQITEAVSDLFLQEHPVERSQWFGALVKHKILLPPVPKMLWYCHLRRQVADGFVFFFFPTCFSFSHYGGQGTTYSSDEIPNSSKGWEAMDSGMARIAGLGVFLGIVRCLCVYNYNSISIYNYGTVHLYTNSIMHNLRISDQYIPQLLHTFPRILHKCSMNQNDWFSWKFASISVARNSSTSLLVATMRSLQPVCGSPGAMVRPR